MDLKLPHLGEGADSGTVVNLFVKEGDQITKDQPILELENEKAVATIPAAAGGLVTRIYVKPGDKLSVGQRILSLGEAGGAAAPAAEAVVARATARPTREKVALTEEAPERPEPAAGGSKAGLAPAAAPSIRKLARDLGIDLTRVRGSAHGGRIVLEDLRAYIQRLQRLAGQPRTAAPTAVPAPAVAAERIDFSQWGSVTQQPLSPLREVIARRMLESWQATPRVTQFDEADITDLMALSKKLAPIFAEKGTRLTLTGLALRIVVNTLKKHPMLNASLDEAAKALVLKNYYHIGVAVDTEGGLIVPVIRDADKQGLVALSVQLEELALKSRERKLAAAELKGGTFTISNQGAIGGSHFTPIINRPEVAILGIGRGKMKPVVRGGNIEARLLLPLTLAYDHRVIDGGMAARFVVDLVKGFEGFSENDLAL